MEQMPVDQPVQECQPDLCLYGGTEGAVFMAVTAARAGLSVLLAAPRQYLYGALPSLGAWETHYPGVRSPLTQEFSARVLRHYAEAYGEGSPECLVAASKEENNPMITFEPSVAEKVLGEMLAAEPGIQILKRRRPVKVHRSGRILEAVTFRDEESAETCRVAAAVFADVSYEADLADLAGVPWRLGREARSEYGETHAGKVFTRYINGKFPLEAVHGKLNLIPKWSTLGLMAGSTGEGDEQVQSYCYRLCLTDDPANRAKLEGPPPEYDPDRYLGILEDPSEGSTRPYPLQHRFLLNTLEDMVKNDHLIHGHQLPRRKRSWNATNFTGAGRQYATAKPERRREIERDHINHAFGILYFLQNDPRVPEGIRKRAAEWGLAKDEFADTDNIPPQMYVREARRICGRYTLTEHDCALAPGLDRAPLHADAIAITEFPIDSLDCGVERKPYSMNDGQFFLMEYSRPGQVPYRCLFPEHIDNLMTPIAASVTHVAWGTYRQTPTLLHSCESAGVAAALAVSENRPPARLDVLELQRALAEAGIMIAFFNDSDMAESDGKAIALQWLAARGFFPNYDARPDEPVGRRAAKLWIEAAQRMRDKAPIEPNELARRIRQAEEGGDPPASMEGLREMIAPLAEVATAGEALVPSDAGTVTRSALAQWLYGLVSAAKYAKLDAS